MKGSSFFGPDQSSAHGFWSSSSTASVPEVAWVAVAITGADTDTVVDEDREEARMQR